ncbi:unnamed protein product [Paramecium pentaurelia]|uniref:Uncharacterized protein n=1 Tax=Paramecium pentaurelia TaxID=43138 RepID=A0A8S1V663_9CILI|nr:unnamed protein product [Paramecium pentaurelia]
MNKPQEYNPYRSKLRRQIIQSNTQNEHSYPQQIKLEIQPSYNEIEIRYEKALKMMEKFEYKFCLEVGQIQLGHLQSKRSDKEIIQFWRDQDLVHQIIIIYFDKIYINKKNIYQQIDEKQRYQIQLQQKILMNISNIKLRLSQDNMVSQKKFLLANQMKIEGRHASEKLTKYALYEIGRQKYDGCIFSR